MFDARRRPFSAGIVYGLMHAVLFGVAFSPFGWWWGVLFAVAPLIVLAARTERFARSAAGAGLASIPMWAFHHQYVWAMSEAGFFPLMAYLGLYPALFVWMLGRVHARWPGLPLALAAPVIWTGLEVLRGEVVWDGYPQYLLAHPLVDRMVAEWTGFVGVYGIGAGLVFSAGVGCDFVADVRGRWLSRWRVAGPVPSETREEGKKGDVSGGGARGLALPRATAFQPFGLVRKLMSAVQLFIACSIVLVAVMTRIQLPQSDSHLVGPRSRLAAIQTNVPQDNRVAQSFEERLRDFEGFCRLTREAAAGEPRPDVIVWPEGMFPGFALNASAVRAERDAGLHYADGTPTTVFYDRLIELQKEIGVPMLVGASAAEGLKIDVGPDGKVSVTQDALFNSAFMVRGGVVEEARYDKMHLMPFGEVMPYISRWDWLEEKLLALGGRGLTFDWEAGTRPTVFEIESSREGEDASGRRLRLAAPICFEAVYADQMRLLAAGESAPVDLLVNVSNDGWFAWFDGGRENLVLQCRWRALELRRPILRAVNTGISAAIDADGRVVSSLPARTAGVLRAEFDVPASKGTISWVPANVVGWVCFAGTAAMVVGSLPLPRSLRSGRGGESSSR